MEMVQSMDDIIENTKTIDKYLKSDDIDLCDYASKLIKRGTCFLIVEENEELRFYPSRFIGYKGNTYNLHENNHEKDGRVTNKAINEILGHDPEYLLEYEEEYKKYCEKLGFTANKAGAFGVQRKYWKI